jgi:hypothetical protein
LPRVALRRSFGGVRRQTPPNESPGFRRRRDGKSGRQRRILLHCAAKQQRLPPRPLPHRYGAPKMQTQSKQANTSISSVASLEFLDPEPVRGGCGYFDSSFELNHGLRVTEELDPTLLQLWARVLGGAMTRH